MGLTPKERAERARQLLDDELMQEVFVEMEQWAVENFMVAPWWTGNRRRRIAAEHLREVRDFKRRLGNALHGVPYERKRSIA